MNCKQLSKKPESNHPYSYDNAVAETSNLTPVKLRTVPFCRRKLITFGLLLSIEVNFA